MNDDYQALSATGRDCSWDDDRSGGRLPPAWRHWWPSRWKSVPDDACYGEYPAADYFGYGIGYDAWGTQSYPGEYFDCYDGEIGMSAGCERGSGGYPAACDESNLESESPAGLSASNAPGRAPLKRPVRLICVGPSFQIGGVEQHTLSLAKFLDPQRVQLLKCLVTNRNHFDARSAAKMPISVEPCEPHELRRAVRDCDAVLMWGAGFNDPLRTARPAVGVFLAHGETWWTRKGLEGSSQVVDHVVAVSQRVKRRVCQGFPTTTILNGVDASRLAQSRSRDAVRERLGFSPGDFVLGSVGRFTREKQIHLLIEAVFRLPRRFKLLLIGYGPRRHELLDLANELIPGRYAFTQADDYLGDHYRAMDAFGLVSQHEGFGLVIAEAMLCQRPVLATNVGCVPELIHNHVNGLVVEPNPDSIADAVRTLQAHPKWARGLGAEGRAIAESRLLAGRMAREYENLLCHLVQARLAAKGGEAS